MLRISLESQHPGLPRQENGWFSEHPARPRRALGLRMLPIEARQDLYAPKLLRIAADMLRIVYEWLPL